MGSTLFFLLLTTSFLQTAAQTLIVQELCDLPSSVSETSGLENGPNGWFWTHNDSDNPEALYCVDTLGNLQRTVNVLGDPNIDS